MLDELTQVEELKASDGAVFDVSVDIEGRYFIHAKFPYLTGSKAYRNNFIPYVRNDIMDKSTAIGIASFACDCYERLLRHSEA
ncbi:hypothetical protein COL30_05300 [Bacillus pseudomycoides]|uniref:hypothetical protein n=1 Tax=Bacillus pseudomycoides TaxID=64104 RepID=UPI0001A14F99|nr:hypothetical protein [Bacillus pseudomycoides]EEM07710.1 hypothetical protein bmyco0003_56320 [Bacillus pseudomycoides]PDY45111.1 hypothetical protein CON79_22005 [Bacillus pseudomycoides]PEA84062.1 hypothetical protein CON99_08370 [Bacillus pseudomycoides]PEK26273.1 hypothetical protein CN693_09490 [Bacillus pseudomycoides]PEO14181.1 hypothetical protein CN542_18590 [Bacillus pseudomycoides]